MVHLQDYKRIHALTLKPKIRLLTKLHYTGQELITVSRVNQLFLCLNYNLQAFKKGMYGTKYVWILNSGRIQDNWWKVQSPLVDCTPEEVRKGLSNNIGTGELKLSPLSGPTKFGKVCNITLSQTVVSPLFTRGEA